MASHIATKHYIDTISGLTWNFTRPVNPKLGEAYNDTATGYGYVWDGSNWIQIPAFDPEPNSMVPTQEQLDKHPALKQAWEEYLVIKTLLGV